MATLGADAESAGFDSMWIAETRITRDAVSGMAAVLLSTAGIRVGSAAINVYTRGAALTAVTWGTLAEAAPGRVILGVGPGSPAPLRQQGYGFDVPLERMCEFVESVRAAWTGEGPVDFDGRHVRFETLTPEVVPADPPPIYLCVTGPLALGHAGRLGDGVVLNAFMPPSYVERARGLLDQGAGGRFDGEVAGALVTAIAESAEDAAARVRPILATYLVHFPNLAKETGLDPEFLERLRTVAAADGLEATLPLLSNETVRRHALCGTPGDCLERIEDYRSVGLELPILFPDPESVQPVIEKLAPA
jgi:5,10-methylenetetrahydromethanopterin reductase